MKFQFDREKFKAVVHYICAACDPDSLGAVKLHKVLYFADMLHFAFHGTPITGSVYRKRPLGPTSDHVLGTLRDLERIGAIEIKDLYYFGYWKKHYVSKQTPDTSRLNQSERDLVDEVIDFVCRNNTAKTISEFSHNRAWERTNFGAELPYHSAFYLLPTQVSEEACEWGAKEMANLESPQSGNRALERRSFADFRSSLQQARGESSYFYCASRVSLRLPNRRSQKLRGATSRISRWHCLGMGVSSSWGLPGGLYTLSNLRRCWDRGLVQLYAKTAPANAKARCANSLRLAPPLPSTLGSCPGNLPAFLGR
jgi:hypothetical protein